MSDDDLDKLPGDPMVPGQLKVPPVHLDDAAAPEVARHDIFFAAVETTRMPMVVTDPHQDDNPIIFCNPAFAKMTGYRPEEIVGQNCRFLQGPESDRAVVAQVREAIAREEQVSVELLNYRKNGSTFWNALFVSPVFGPDGKLLYFFASQLDISRRKEAEEALHQAQKMEAVGKLTGGIAHDFNNLLQVVLGYVDLLENRIDAGDRTARRAIDAIGAAANRGATLTQQLLAFARRQELRDRLLNLNTLVVDFGPVIDRNLGEHVDFRRELSDDLWNSRIDPVQAEMALLNLLSNARDAMDDTGLVTIGTENVVSTAEAPLAVGLEPGEYVALSVADTGRGIDTGDLDKIFDPFFSTKGVGKGTGLGLSMVYGFMRQSGGGVAAANLPDGGARFTLYFPRARHGRAGACAADPGRRRRRAYPDGRGSATGGGARQGDARGARLFGGACRYRAARARPAARGRAVRPVVHRYRHAGHDRRRAGTDRSARVPRAAHPLDDRLFGSRAGRRQSRIRSGAKALSPRGTGPADHAAVRGAERHRLTCHPGSLG